MDTNRIIDRLSQIVAFEDKQPDNHKFGAILAHWTNPGDSITIDSGALKALIEYYKQKGDA